MRHATRTNAFILGAALLGGYALDANADAVTDWNATAGRIVVESKMGTPPAVRVMAIVQTAVYEALGSVSPSNAGEVDAAVAAANRATLLKLVPSQQAAIEKAYQGALASIADGPAKTAGVGSGEASAAAVLQRHEGGVAPAAYRPHTTAGAYVPTSLPAVPQWPERKPWVMTSASQFRPAPPPALSSPEWARNYNEVKALGSQTSTSRTPEQTQIALFWDFSLPPIYFGVVQSVAEAPGRDAMRNARMYAAVAQAMDDALIAVFDAKYHYNFWRPTTAIRNGDIDGNDATVRDASWTPFIDVPLHPEYPSAHAILAGSVAGVLKAELGAGPTPVLRTASPTAKGAVRQWTSLDDFVREVGNARVYEGVHYRVSTEVGAAMGGQIGALTARRLMQPGASVADAGPDLWASDF